MPKQRKFALQAVLDYRRHVEESALRVLAEHRRACDANVSRRARCEVAIKEYTRALHAAGQVRLENARACDTQSAVLSRAVENDRVAAARARAGLDDARRAATAAARERRAIEILRDRHVAVIAAADRKAEEAEISELDALRPRLR